MKYEQNEKIYSRSPTGPLKQGYRIHKMSFKLDKYKNRLSFFDFEKNKVDRKRKVY